jgi:hypothetical protein
MLERIGTAMRSRLAHLSVGLVAAFVLALGVGSAQARRFELSAQHIRAVWTRLPFNWGETIECPVTLEGSFHSRTLSKVSGALIGYITAANTIKGAENCVGGWGMLFLTPEEGFSGALNTLPWHVRYDSFEGMLPTIAGIRVDVVGFAIRFRRVELGVTIRCLYRSLETSPVSFIFRLAAGVVTGLQADERSEIFWNSGETFCARRGHFVETPQGSVTVQGTATRVTVRLVQ